MIFSNNPIYEYWKKNDKKDYLIEYILPTEDLEDINLIKKEYLNLENYDFQDIIKKYFLDHSIIALFFKDENQVKILSKINIKGNTFIKSDSFSEIDLKNIDNLNLLIGDLKIIYEDFWKDNNLINSSIKLPLFIQVKNNNFDFISKFEETLNTIDLINSYSISRFNKDYIFYEIIFNGTTKNFINIMEDNDYKFNTQKKTWILE